MKIIITCDDGQEEYALRLINSNVEMFNRHGNKIGWGWHFHERDKPTFFLRQIKGGISAMQMKS
ncbi:MAG: hypothetical protein ACSLE1_03180 [Sphingobium sp.]